MATKRKSVVKKTRTRTPKSEPSTHMYVAVGWSGSFLSGIVDLGSPSSAEETYQNENGRLPLCVLTITPEFLAKHGIKIQEVSTKNITL